MSRTQHILIPLLIFLLGAPGALAQVQSDTSRAVTMTEDQVREARMDMQNRMDRLDTDFRDLERQASTINDPQRRAEVERQVDQFRQQHDEVRTQVDELSTASATTYSMERQGLMDRYNELDRSLQQARLNAASTPQAYRRLSTDQLDRFDRDLAMMSERLDRVPEAHRSRSAYDLIRLRQHRDALSAQNRRLARMSGDEFDAMRRQQTEALSRLDNDLRSTMTRHNTATMNNRMGQGQAPIRN